MTPSVCSLFRQCEPSCSEVDAFHRDGYILYPDVFTSSACEELTEEIYKIGSVREYLHSAERNSNPPICYFARPWNERGPLGHRLIDDPFVTGLLEATIGSAYHFCHSALNLAPRGISATPYHQDHHHWKHDNPVNLKERRKYYIQVLYYLNGFRQGDRNLKVIPGSHLVAPTREVTAERLLGGVYDVEAGRSLLETRLEVPPGSMVYINARIFHAVEGKPIDSSQPFRLFNIDIFKEAGPPHRYTQEIPPAWFERAGTCRRQLFLREAYRDGCWTS